MQFAHMGEGFSSMEGILGSVCGMKVYESEFAMTAEQIKKHRKKRINKKWLKRYGTKQVPCMYMVAGDLIAHPDVMDRVVRVSL